MESLKRMIALRQEMVKIDLELSELKPLALAEALEQDKQTFKVDEVKVQVRYLKVRPKKGEFPDLDNLWQSVEAIADGIKTANAEKLAYHEEVINANLQDIRKLETSPELEQEQEKATALMVELTRLEPSLTFTL